MLPLGSFKGTRVSLRIPQSPPWFPSAGPARSDLSPSLPLALSGSLVPPRPGLSGLLVAFPLYQDTPSSAPAPRPLPSRVLMAPCPAIFTSFPEKHLACSGESSAFPETGAPRHLHSQGHGSKRWEQPRVPWWMSG